ncbi:MAG: ABC transporter substrate-binding protein [Ruminococcus sp.]|nr:ABC transporter substrate-binding protein [Ruminococcus sp.]
MKRNKIILCAMMCLCGILTACENKKNTPEPAPVPVVETEITGYRPAEIRLADDFDKVISIDTNVGDVYIFGQLKTGGYSGYSTDGTFSEYKKMNFIPQKNEIVKSSSLMVYGKKAILTYLDGKTMVYIYSRDGEQEKIIDCGELSDSPDVKFDIFPCSRDYYIINADNKRLVLINDDGYVSDIEVSGDIIGVARGAENTVNCLCDNGNEKFIENISNDSGNIKVVRKKTDVDSSVYASCMGEKYTFIGVTDDGIYGFGDGKSENITDFSNMDFKPSEVTDIIETSDGYAVVVNGCIYFVTEENITELSTKKIIWMGTYGNPQFSLIKKYADYYNESSDEYKVDFKEYDLFSDSLRADVLSGNAPDIISLNNSGNIYSYRKNKELFVDMYPFIDNDPEISREDFLPNILNILESDGKLLQIGTHFRVNTSMASADSDIPENWTVDDMIKTYNNLKENEVLFPDNELHMRTNAFQAFFDNSMYIDYENATCSFDSPDFIKYLEFFQKNEICLTAKEYDEALETSVTIGEDELKERIIYSNRNILCADNLYYISKGIFKDKMIFAGYVGDGTKSGTLLDMDNLYGISAVSPNIDGAWEFLRTLFTDHTEKGLTSSYYFPVMEEEFDKEFEVYTRDNVYVDSKTKKTVIEKRTYNENETIENFTKEECEYYKDKITSARLYINDFNIDSIINEKVYRYFEGIDGSAEQTAKNIQKEVSEYLKEHYT